MINRETIEIEGESAFRDKQMQGEGRREKKNGSSYLRKIRMSFDDDTFILYFSLFLMHMYVFVVLCCVRIICFVYKDFKIRNMLYLFVICLN